MADSITLTEYKQAEQVIAGEEAKTGFEIHSAIFVLVNTLLIIINLINRDQGIWFFYPLIGWGIGLTVHYLAGVRNAKNNVAGQQAKAEQRAMQTHAQG